MTDQVHQGSPRPFRSTARVATNRPALYAKRLASHLGRRTPADEIPGGYRLHLPLGFAYLSNEDDALVLRAEAADEDALARVEDVVGQNLLRFADDDDLVVDWRRDHL